jgi:acyl carrier protein
MTVFKTLTPDQLKQIIFTVVGQIAPEADLQKLNPDEELQRALDIDSFDFLNVLIGINQEIGVEVPEADYGQVNTLNRLVSYLSQRL